MSWFGFGGSDDNSSSSSSSSSSVYDTTSFPGDDSTRAYSSPSYTPSGGGGSADAFQNDVMMLQQAQLSQMIVSKLTETAFKKCVTRPSSSLSSSEKSCISAQVGKYIEASQYVVQGLSQQ